MLRIRDAIGMRFHMAIENVNIAVLHQLAQVIIGAAIAKPEFDDAAGRAADDGCGIIETVALRTHAPDKAVKPAHVHPHYNSGPILRRRRDITPRPAAY